ncbi:unnamed protein product [Mytilus edulis]|uniref:Uncharacterized protein n=1 Tax=Mytilus edulis TaxID=6550 RepID=A0A8S3VLM8_MYTED|nr:unnamed protein product [Mytilus edulis]
MMPSSTFDDVCEKFGIIDGKCKRTSWLCFKFDFLPPSFFNHITAWFIRKYKPSKIDSGYALYRGICMLDIDESGCEKILVTMSTDIIALQVVSFSEQAEGFGSICSDIYSEVGQSIKDMKMRYKVKISFKLNFKCSNGDYNNDTFEYSTLKTTQEFYCRQHQTAHLSEQIYLPWMKAESPMDIMLRCQSLLVSRLSRDKNVFMCIPLTTSPTTVTSLCASSSYIVTRRTENVIKKITQVPKLLKKY